MRRWTHSLSLVIVCAIGSACGSQTDTPSNAPANGAEIDGGASGHDGNDSGGADASDPGAAFDGCTCTNIPDDPAPGFCKTPRTIMVRSCVVDASCHAYKFELEEATTIVTRHDIAIRYELVEPMPADADLTVNIPGDKVTQKDEVLWGGLQLHATKTWSPEDGPVAKPETRVAGKARMSADRLAVTVVPDPLDGTWVVEPSFGFDKFYGPDVCGEGDNLQGYGARFELR